jgi:hypothetical protein
MFDPSSRYFNLETVSLQVKEADGTVRSLTISLTATLVIPCSFGGSAMQTWCFEQRNSRRLGVRCGLHCLGFKEE